MRRPLLVALTLAAVTLSGCAPALEGPSAPIAREQVPIAPALAGASSRRTVLDFVEAYASSPLDGSAALADLVTGDELERWVYWLGVQNAQFPGRIDGEAEVRDVAFIGITPANRALGAQVELGATVTFTFAPVDDDPFERARILDGPVTLLSSRPGDWRVLDITRDGVPMSEGIELFEDEERADRGISVRLDSLFMFTPNWQFNVVVENRSGTEIGLDALATGLFFERTGGTFDRVEGAPSPALASIPEGTGVQSLVSFPLQDSADGLVLVLTFLRDGRPYRFDFPLEDLVTVVPPPPPTAGGDAERTTG